MVKKLFEARGLNLFYLTEHNREHVRKMGLGDMLKCSAFCMRINDGDHYTFCAENLPPDNMEFILAHELGHILMGHLTDRPGCTSEEGERMANIFGAVMLALSLYDEYKKMEVKSHAK